MTLQSPLEDLPIHLKEEVKQLLNNGINNWELISYISDKDINKLSKSNLVSERNLKKLRAMAKIIYKIGISQPEAALLLHSGIHSTEILANLKPQELIRKTGRFKRQLNADSIKEIDMQTAMRWINCAKGQIIN